MSSDVTLLRRKRDWVSHGLWRFFARTRLGLYTPFREILTAKVKEKPKSCEHEWEDIRLAQHASAFCEWCSKCGTYR